MLDCTEINSLFRCRAY